MKFTIEKDRIKGTLGFAEITVSPNESNGYRPFELFVTALAGCSGTFLESILTKRRHPFQKLEMEVNSVRNPNQANRIEQLSFIAYVHCQDQLKSQQAEKIAELVIKNCGMIQSVIQSIDISFSIKCLPLDGDTY
ncbi:OsmC family protein [Mesobacillus foraminis]|uniref:OsmC family protein n=1 Tax=Mesobacillus foraminis TaxID=279826 RepID=UPI000EF4A0FC|nr:OsmC family protein [Mesobacillus foraminis]